jgi:predicted transcriptional regulator
MYICGIKRKTMAQVNKNEAIVIRVDPSLKGSLQKMADSDNRKLSDFIRVQLMKMVEAARGKK